MDLIVNFLADNAPKIIWIFVIVLGGNLTLKMLANRLVARVDDSNDATETGKEKRAKTLARLLLGAGNIIILIIALVAILQSFGIDPMPVVAGAGVLGFAIGFGAQALIKDFIAGIFIFAENQFAVGDKVKIGAVEGIVYNMGVRSTVIIDNDGNFVFIPNGTIANVVNYSLGEHRRGRK